MVMSGCSANLTTLFLGKLRPPKWLTSTKSTYFRKKLTNAFLESEEGEIKVADRASNQGPLALESDMLSTGLCSLAGVKMTVSHVHTVKANGYTFWGATLSFLIFFFFFFGFHLHVYVCGGWGGGCIMV